MYGSVAENASSDKSCCAHGRRLHSATSRIEAHRARAGASKEEGFTRAFGEHGRRSRDGGAALACSSCEEPKWHSLTSPACSSILSGLRSP